MVSLPLADCARMLGIHPKTFHHWLTQAKVPFTAHPTDARIKCVTEDQLQRVARLHGRPLQSPASPALPEGACVLPSSQGQATPSQAKEVAHFLTAGSLPPCSSQEVDLIQKLSCLETKVITMQEQLAQLALALLQERERSVERRLSALETITVELVGRPVLPTPFPEPQATGTAPEQARAPHQPRQLNPAEQRARSRLPPLIEYGAQGTYVIVSSQEGELHLAPDSPEWFDWLASLSSFRFVGPQGRFTANRQSDRRGPTRFWRAHRCIRGRPYKHYLGTTDHLTIARLEQAAVILQSRMEKL